MPFSLAWIGGLFWLAITVGVFLVFLAIVWGILKMIMGKFPKGLPKQSRKYFK